MTLLVIPLVILVSLAYGGWRLIREIRVVKVLSIRGALFAFVCFCRYLVYGAGVAIFCILFAIIFVPESNRSFSFGHEFNIELDENIYSIVRTDTNETEIRLESVTGSVDMANASDNLIVIVAILATIILVVLHQLLRHAEPVLLSLYNRVPFTKDNAEHTRKAAILILLVWFLYYIYMVGMTVYFAPRLDATGLSLTLVDLPSLSALFTAGVVFVLSEVFRVGHELKEEQDYTV